MRKRHFVVVDRYAPVYSIWSSTPDRMRETMDCWSEDAISPVTEWRSVRLARLHVRWLEWKNRKVIGEWWAKVEEEEEEMFDAIDEQAELRKAALDHRGRP